MMKKIINIGLFILLFQLVNGNILFAQEDIRDVKGPLDIPVNMKMWLIIGIVAALAGMGTAIFLLLKNKKKKEVIIIPPDPWEVAYKELNELNQTDLIVKELFKEYFSRLSDIMRKYFETQLHINAPEMTTEEFLISLRSSRKLNETQKEALKEFLMRCDLVKFAKFPTTSIEATEGFELVKSLVDNTKPKEIEKE